jgi:hypothetical protein
VFVFGVIRLQEYAGRPVMTFPLLPKRSIFAGISYSTQPSSRLCDSVLPFFCRHILVILSLFHIVVVICVTVVAYIYYVTVTPLQVHPDAVCPIFTSVKVGYL